MPASSTGGASSCSSRARKPSPSSPPCARTATPTAATGLAWSPTCARRRASLLQRSTPSRFLPTSRRSPRLRPWSYVTGWTASRSPMEGCRSRSRSRTRAVAPRSGHRPTHTSSRSRSRRSWRRTPIASLLTTPKSPPIPGSPGPRVAASPRSTRSMLLPRRTSSLSPCDSSTPCMTVTPLRQGCWRGWASTSRTTAGCALSVVGPTRPCGRSTSLPSPVDPHEPSSTRLRVAADLERLAGEQDEDGGWSVDFQSYSPAAALEWRGYATVRALSVLRDNAMIDAPARQWPARHVP